MTQVYRGRLAVAAMSAAILLTTPACTASMWGSGGSGQEAKGQGHGTAAAHQARLSWSPVDPDAYGVARGRDPVAGFHVYSGRSPATLRRVATLRDTSATHYVVRHLPRGKWYFTVSTFTRRGVESELPPPVAKTIR